MDDKDQPITPQQARALLDRCVLAPETMTLKVGNPTLLNTFLNCPPSPTSGWCAGDVDQGVEEHLGYNARSYPQIERRTRSARQRFGGKGRRFSHLPGGEAYTQN